MSSYVPRKDVSKVMSNRRLGIDVTSQKGLLKDDAELTSKRRAEKKMSFNFLENQIIYFGYQMRQEIANIKEEIDQPQVQASGGDTRNHTVAGRGDTTPVVDAKQPFPGCHGIQQVGGATMPLS